jgi:SNF2 family DNA or RNA helicase
MLIIETVQVIAFLTAAFGKKGNSTDKKRMRLARDRNLAYPRILIICPGSVMSNWERELNTVRLSHEISADNIVGMVAYFIIPRSK